MLFIAGLFTGAVIGYATACLMVAAGNGDRKIKYVNKEDLEEWD